MAKTLRTDTLIYFAAGMKRRRLELEMTQGQVAFESGLSTMTVNHLENAKRVDVELSTLESIAHALHTSLPILLVQGKSMKGQRSHKRFRLPLGHRIAELRHDQQLTKQQLAQIAGVSGGYLGEVERGANSVSIDKLTQICDALGVSVAWILSEAEKIFEKSELD